jgi:hypothetical protein
MNRILLCALFLFSACNTPKSKPVAEKPADLIPEEKMIQVIADVHELEAALNLRFPQPNRPTMQNKTMEIMRDTFLPQFSPDPANNAPLPWYDIFSREGVTKKQYESSMKYYCTDPEKLSTMYDEVIVELTKRQTKDRTGK